MGKPKSNNSQFSALSLHIIELDREVVVIYTGALFCRGCCKTVVARRLTRRNTACTDNPRAITMYHTIRVCSVMNFDETT